MKFCGKCEEGFAERFAFCPSCGGELQVFEMSPINKANSAGPIAPPAAPAILATEKSDEVLDIPEFETISSADPVAPAETVYSLPEETKAEEIKAEEPAKAPVSVPVAAAAIPVAKAANADGKNAGKDSGKKNGNWREVKSVNRANDGLYHLTMVENKTFFNDPRMRAAGLTGLVLVVAFFAGAFIYDLMTQVVTVDALGEDETGFAYIPVDTDATIEEIMEELKTKDNNTGGGGGGGGGKDPDPPKQGNIPNMYKNKPDLPPTTHDRTKMENPTMPLTSGITGPFDRKGDQKNPGVTRGGSKVSDGMGDGGIGMNGSDGIGNNGRDGYGNNGRGGVGSGPGGGIGDGPGDGSGREAPPEMPKGPTVSVRVISQPKPPYTEEARKNQINGTVVLRVTFNANGTIGGITAVRGLGYGLTEQAIAAARRMTFEPAKKGGVPVTSSKTVQYSFTLY